MIREDVYRLVETTIRELGPLRFSAIQAEVQEFPCMAVLLRRDHVIGKRGPVPFKGGQWQHCSGGMKAVLGDTAVGLHAYDVTNKDFFYAAGSARKVVDMIQVKRHAALAECLSYLEKVFRHETGNADPEKWRLVILQDEWMRETAVLAGEEVHVFLDATFAFEPMPEEGADEPAVVSQQDQDEVARLLKLAGFPELAGEG